MGYNIINSLFSAPQLTANQVDIKWSATSTATAFFDATIGSDFPAMSGYVLVNSGSSASSVVATFLNGTATLTTLATANGNYQAFYVLGANIVQFSTTGADTANGDFNVVFSNNPF